MYELLFGFLWDSYFKSIYWVSTVCEYLTTMEICSGPFFVGYFCSIWVRVFFSFNFEIHSLRSSSSAPMGAAVFWCSTTCSTYPSTQVFSSSSLQEKCKKVLEYPLFASRFEPYLPFYWNDLAHLWNWPHFCNYLSRGVGKNILSREHSFLLRAWHSCTIFIQLNSAFIEIFCCKWLSTKLHCLHIRDDRRDVICQSTSRNRLG